MLVHPDHAGVDPRRYGECPLPVRRPDRAAQAELRVVGTRYRVVDVGVAQHRQYRSELLLADQPGTVGDVADNGRLDEVALAFKHAAAGNDLAILPGVL